MQRASEGAVKLQVVLMRDGHVASSKVLHSSGDRTLDAAAQTAVAKWHMNPAAVRDSDLTKGRIEIVEFKQEPIIGARYPDRTAYFSELKGVDKWMFAPFPSYPLDARRHYYTGQTLVKATTGSDGRVISVELLQSSGHKELDQCALAAVKLWRVHKQYAGETYRVPITFAMPGSRRVPNFW